MKQGGMVSDTVIVTLLKDAMKQAFHTHHGQTGWENGRGRFLIDGFPRTMEQAMLFEREVRFMASSMYNGNFEFEPSAQICVPDMTILFDTTEELMLKRVLERAATSGRVDDNAEVMTKRFSEYMHRIATYRMLSMLSESYQKETQPVLDYLRTCQARPLPAVGSLDTIRLLLFIELMVLVPDLECGDHRQSSTGTASPSLSYFYALLIFSGTD
jgi:adenylate kinase family enzyme